MLEIGQKSGGNMLYLMKIKEKLNKKVACSVDVYSKNHNLIGQSLSRFKIVFLNNLAFFCISKDG
jgi:hypothetical protein